MAASFPSPGVALRSGAVLRALAGLAVCVLLAGCDTTRQAKASLRKFIPPPVHKAQPESVEIAGVPLPALESRSAPRIQTPALATAVPPRPSAPATLMNRADRLFADGKRAVQEHRLADARRAFDGAIETLMSEPLPPNPAERRKLEEKLDDLTDAIYHYDLEHLGSAIPDPDADQPADTSIEKQLLETNLPINPILRDQVREQIEQTMSELPLEVTDAVVSYIEYFSTDRGRRILLSGFARAGRYRDMISRVFASEGLPEELIHVAQLESHFNPTAISKARAVGMWQFMQSAGKEYDLTIDRSLDERRDPEKATRAAARYLMNLYRRYGDWYLALGAYNCGPGCMDRAIQRTGYADFWELRRLRALPLATTNYVPEILAMTIMFKNAEAYGIDIETDPLLEYDNIVLEEDTTLELVASALDRPVGQVKELNPALLKTVAPKGYTLHLPAGEGETIEAVFQVVPPKLRTTGRVHRFDIEDTWATVAQKYGTSVSKLLELNPGYQEEAVPLPGEFAAIPPKAAPAAKKAAPKKATPKPPAKKAAATTTSPRASTANTNAKKASAAGKSQATPQANAKTAKAGRG